MLKSIFYWMGSYSDIFTKYGLISEKICNFVILKDANRISKNRM